MASTAKKKKKKRTAVPEGTTPLLFLAEFETTADVLHAAEKTRDEGYKSWDVHTPFPVHGMDAAMGLPDSRLGWLVLFFGLCGTAFAFTWMWWTNGMDYPIIIGGKPGFSIPSMLPIMFELTVLLASFGAVLGMFALNKLPRHHHPVFYSDRFDRHSDDRFFISIEANDEKFDLEETREFLESLHPTHIELIEESDHLADAEEEEAA